MIFKSFFRWFLKQVYWFVYKKLTDPLASGSDIRRREMIVEQFLTGPVCGIAPAVIAAIIAGAQMLGGAMSDPGEQTVKQESALSPEQKQAMQAMLQYAQTGQLSGFDTTGMYDMTAAEQQGQNTLLNLLSQNPDLFSASQNEYMNILNDGYNPYTSPTYQAYKDNAMKELADASDALNRNLGASGKFFSTSRNKSLGDLYTDTQRNLNNTMAGLYENNIDRKYNAAGALANLQNAMQTYDINKVNAANTSGGLSRELQQQDFNSRTGAYGTILNKNVDYYTPEVTTGQDNSMWNSIITGGLTNILKK